MYSRRYRGSMACLTTDEYALTLARSVVLTSVLSRIFHCLKRLALIGFISCGFEEGGSTRLR